MHPLDSEEKIPFSISDTNILMCAMLTQMVEEKVLTEQEGLTAKKVFNTLIEQIVEETEVCRELIDGIKEAEKEIAVEELEDEAWKEITGDNIIESAVAIAEKAIKDKKKKKKKKK